MKYLAIFEENIPKIFQLQWNIGNIFDMFLQYSVLRGYFVKKNNVGSKLIKKSYLFTWNYNFELIITIIIMIITCRMVLKICKIHSQNFTNNREKLCQSAKRKL